MRAVCTIDVKCEGEQGAENNTELNERISVARGKKVKHANESVKKLYLYTLTLYILCLPLGAMNIGTLGSALKILAILPVVIAIFGGIQMKCAVPIINQLLFVLFATFSIAWSRNSALSIDRVVGYVLLLVLVASGGVFEYSTEEMQKIKSALRWSSRLTALAMVLFADFSYGRLWLEGVITEDPNYLCAYWTFGIVGDLEVLSKRGSRTGKTFAGIELITYLLLVLLTGSRGGLLAIIACVVAFFFADNKGRIGKKLVLISMAGLAIMVLMNYLPEDLQMRFTIDDVVESNGTGRIDIWEQAIDLFKDSDIFRKMFGQGTATIVWCFRYFGYSRIKVTHNIFLETLVELGVIGLLLYMSAIFSFIKAAWNRRNAFAFGVIMGMLVLSLSTSLYTFKPYFNIMLYIVMLFGEQKDSGNMPNRKSTTQNQQGLVPRKKIWRQNW